MESVGFVPYRPFVRVSRSGVRCRVASSNGTAVVRQDERAIEEAGHYAMVQGLGQIGEVNTNHLPWLIRLAHIRSLLSLAKDDSH